MCIRDSIGTAVAAGIAYYKKYRQLLDSCKDEYDDYDEDLEEEDEDVDFTDDEPGSSTASREYVPLKFDRCV